MPMPHSLAHEEARIKDAYARRQEHERYSFLQPGELFMVQEFERVLLRTLRRQGVRHLADCRLLEIGCGAGHWLRAFVQWGARPEHLYGVDLLPERIAQARALSPPAMHLHCGSATALDFPDAMFDLVLQATVFTSILDPTMQQHIAAEMLRVLKPQGCILWYDYHVNNPWNPDVRGVPRRDIARLFPGCSIRLRRLTLLPPLTRRLAPYAWSLCALLNQLPWLCTHYLGVIRKQPQEGAVRRRLLGRWRSTPRLRA